MKFFTKYSLLVNVFAIVIVVFSTIFIYSEAVQGGSDPKKFSPSSSVELTAFNFHYNNYNDDGKLTTNFITEKLEQYVNQDIKMTNLIETSYDEKTGDETWRVKAPKGFSQKKDNNELIHLFDGVNAILFTKNQQADSGESSAKQTPDADGKYLPNKIYIKSSEMYYDTETHDYYNDKFVKVYDPDTENNTTGIGIVGNSDTKVINFKKDVRSYYASS
ncbi:LPS export ABC transporter periplasmic protein LptC [Allofrancisella frigidaquae]|uniref:LPS export ABC transporter periplasmic protein LptC n=1 Tax=Allofrancisella frigidaquae TaxID=1085644 RepID=A0A6M3HT08_9GAMM|nr:LPS export ABC transporter periplasmic protein LptC [Allofrancisella frigidaquae]QIV94323.1 LPS export ABC transporter periplasmic protein LptC [Allofrancisella frigidaquae]